MKRIRPFTGLLLVLVMVIMSACGSSTEPTQEQTEPAVTTESKEQSDTEPVAATESQGQSDTEDASSTKEPAPEETQTEEVDLSVLNGQYYTLSWEEKSAQLGEITFNPDHTCTLIDGKNYKWSLSTSNSPILIEDSDNSSFELVPMSEDLTIPMDIAEINNGARYGSLFLINKGVQWFRNLFDSQMAGVYQCLYKNSDETVDSFEIFEDATALINDEKYSVIVASNEIYFCNKDGKYVYSIRDASNTELEMNLGTQLKEGVLGLVSYEGSIVPQTFYINTSAYDMIELTAENFFDYFELEDHLLEFEPVYDKDFGDYQGLSTNTEYGMNYYSLVPRSDKNVFAYTLVAEYRFNTFETYSINYNIDTKETEISLQKSSPYEGDNWSKLTAYSYKANDSDEYRIEATNILERIGKEGNIDSYRFSVGRDFTLNRVKGTLYFKK